MIHGGKPEKAYKNCYYFLHVNRIIVYFLYLTLFFAF